MHQRYIINFFDKKFLIISLIIFSPFNFSKEAFYPEYLFISAGERTEDMHEYQDVEYPTTLIGSNSVYSFGIGFNLNSNILEINYTDLGKTLPAVDTQGNAVFLYEMESIQLNTVINSDFTTRLKGFLKLGISYLKPTVTRTNNSFKSKSSTELLYGLGLSYSISDSFEVFYEFIDTNHELPINDINRMTSYYLFGIKYFLK